MITEFHTPFTHALPLPQDGPVPRRAPHRGTPSKGTKGTV